LAIASQDAEIIVEHIRHNIETCDEDDNCEKMSVLQLFAFLDHQSLWTTVQILKLPTTHSLGEIVAQKLKNVFYLGKYQ
jgi:hypothetical protein